MSTKEPVKRENLILNQSDAQELSAPLLQTEIGTYIQYICTPNFKLCREITHIRVATRTEAFCCFANVHVESKERVGRRVFVECIYFRTGRSSCVRACACACLAFAERGSACADFRRLKL